MSKELQSAELAEEIAAAMFRVAALVGHSRLRFELEGAAVELVKDTSREGVRKLKRLVRLTAAIGQMSAINDEVLERELDSLQKMLNAEISVSSDKSLDSVNLEQIFGLKSQDLEKMAGENGEEIGNQDERQAAVFRYIRKFPHGCRMRQISAAFAGFSERTVRSDINRLIDKGLVERVGSKTGPFSYFRARSTSSGQVSLSSSNFQPEGVDLSLEAPVTEKLGETF